MESYKSQEIQYLQMVQENISRLSNIGLVIKGFAITMIVAYSSFIYTYDIKEPTLWSLLLLATPIFFILYLDTYYLCLENKYRELYELIRTKQKETDFNLNLHNINNIVFRSKKRDCLKSKCILFFYIPLFIIIIANIITKLN